MSGINDIIHLKDQNYILCSYDGVYFINIEKNNKINHLHTNSDINGRSLAKIDNQTFILTMKDENDDFELVTYEIKDKYEFKKLYSMKLSGIITKIINIS